MVTSILILMQKNYESISFLYTFGEEKENQKNIQSYQR